MTCLPGYLDDRAIRERFWMQKPCATLTSEYPFLSHDASLVNQAPKFSIALQRLQAKTASHNLQLILPDFVKT